MDKAELDRISLEIAEQGPADDKFLVEMAKGVKDAADKIGSALAVIVEMAKGRAPPKKEEPAADAGGEGGGGEGEGGQGGEGDGKGDGDEPEPGYEDMEMAVPGAAILDKKPEEITAMDVTEFMFTTGGAMRDLVKASNAQARLLRDVLAGYQELKTENAILLGQNAQLAQVIVDSNASALGILAPLAKATMHTQQLIQQIPAPGITPAVFPRPKPPPVDAAPIGGSVDNEERALMKAMTARIIGTAEKNTFKRTRRFSADAAEHESIRKQIETIAANLT